MQSKTEDAGNKQLIEEARKLLFGFIVYSRLRFRFAVRKKETEEFFCSKITECLKPNSPEEK